MTTEIRSNWLTKQLDKIFDDKCLFSKSGTQQRGPGFLCGLYIILIIVGLVFNIVLTDNNMTKYCLSRGQVVLQNIIDVAVALFSIVFIYHMCYICRGFLGFVILIVINMCISMIRMMLFKDYTEAILKHNLRNNLRK